jgi:hypothetical protein
LAFQLLQKNKGKTGQDGQTVRGTVTDIVTKLLCFVLWLAFPAAAMAEALTSGGGSWSKQDEEGYSAFVQAIGESDCPTPDDCINSSANPLRREEDGFIDFNADCADLIYMLRAYYAWKKGLPFTFTTGVTPAGAGGIRFSSGGNRASGRRLVTGVDIRSLLRQLRDGTSSAMFRIGPGADEAPPSDFYPVKIQRGSIRPGTAIYDPNGHVAMVYKVGEDGRVHYMDSHPDFTLSRSVYGAQFGRDLPELGGGFKNFRPFQVIGGRAAMASNSMIADYSTEQYFGAVNSNRDWRAARFTFEGADTGYYEFVRLRLAKGTLTFNPVTELQESLRTLCNDFYDRQKFVERAIEAGMDRRPHPARLPDNIYGSSDHLWETYSTPSRDARLKSAFAALRADTARLIERFNTRDPRIKYTGLDLQSDLARAYQREADRCTVVYRTSADEKVILRLPELTRRLFALSFSPYDCVERRWGASSTEELRACANTADKERWYAALQPLRNQLERVYGARMGFTVQDMEAGAAGQPKAPDVDVLSLIQGARIRPVADDSPKARAP